MKPEANLLAKPETLLQKVVGGLNNEAGKYQLYDCKVSSNDLADLAKVQALITEALAAPMNTAMLFRAQEPSIQYFVYKDGKQELIYEFASTLMTRNAAGKPDMLPAAKEIMQLVDGKCPTPKP